MRILMIAPPWFTVPPSGYGGIEWVVSELTEGLVERGHEVVLVASGGSRTSADLVTVFEQPPSEELGSPWRDLVHVLGAYHRIDGFDIVHDHSGIIGPAIGALLAARGAGPPVVHTLHGPWTAEASQLYLAMPPDLRLVAISEDQRRRAPTGLSIEGVVHNGIPVERFPFRGQHRNGEGPLAFVGRANPDKGPDLAIEAARRLGRPLLMALKVNEPEEHEYWEQVVVPLLEDNPRVEVVPNADHAAKTAIMAAADALLVPIRWPEPFGLVMAEAAACGTPVVAFGTGAAPEVVSHGQTGLIVPPGDMDAFCAAVLCVGEIDPGVCRAHAEERFSRQRMVADYLAIYERVLQSTRKGPTRAGSASSTGTPSTTTSTPGGDSWTNTPPSRTIVIDSDPSPSPIPPA